jgi:predicted nuclease with TOPRIM domain
MAVTTPRGRWTDSRLDDLGKKVGDGFAEVDKKFDKVDDRFAEVDKKFDKVDDRFDKVDEKFDKVDDRFDKLDEKFDRKFDRLMWVLLSTQGGIIAVLIGGFIALLRSSAL